MPSLRFDPPCFQREHEWIAALIDMLRDRKDVGLLVRVHPREFSGAKPAGPRAVPSENARRLMELLAHVPDNVKVNWPSDDVSLYDIASETTVFLTAWSSVAKEAALLGVPALGYAPQWTWYPIADLAHVAEDRATYRRMLEAALDEPDH